MKEQGFQKKRGAISLGRGPTPRLKLLGPSLGHVDRYGDALLDGSTNCRICDSVNAW